jgi:endonuclease-3
MLGGQHDRKNGFSMAKATTRRSKKPAAKKFKTRSWRESRATQSERMDEIVRRLHELYPGADCALSYSSPWELLVATILSAQCTDERVNKETPALFARYPTIEAMAAAGQEEMEEMVRRTGFFRNKARAIREAAAAIVENFGGELPRDLDQLLTLRGVARKTANVVLGTAFGIPSGVVVDTHIGRLSQRLGLTKETSPEKIEQVLMELMDRDEWIFTGHAIIWHGRQVCDARKPLCSECRLSDICPSSIAEK